MRFHPWEVFGLAGLIVGDGISIFFGSWVGFVIALMAAVPLFIGQQIRHRTWRDE